jgi:hypothetical protein
MGLSGAPVHEPVHGQRPHVLAAVHDLGPEERILGRAALRLLPSGHPHTRPGPPAPRPEACTTAVRHEDLLFPNEPTAGGAEDRRAIADARPPMAHRAR